MPRFFTDVDPAEEIYLDGEDGRHISRSLRMKPGEELVLSNGRGTDFLCAIVSCDENGARLRVLSSYENKSEPKTKITVCQCIPKGDKLETVVQKSVELGAAEILLVESSRCIAKMEGSSVKKKTERLQKIALEAAKQSGRGIIPPVLPPLPLIKALQRAKSEGDLLFFYEKGTESLKSALQKTGDRLFIFIGPEGGFSPEEAQAAKALGAPLLTLGPRILRTETAPIAALSAILFEKNDF